MLSEDVETPPRPASLEVAICQRVHHYEWFDNTGRRRDGSRSHACHDCQLLAAAVVDYWVAGGVIA